MKMFIILLLVFLAKTSAVWNWYIWKWNINNTCQACLCNYCRIRAGMQLQTTTTTTTLLLYMDCKISLWKKTLWTSNCCNMGEKTLLFIIILCVMLLNLLHHECYWVVLCCVICVMLHHIMLLKYSIKNVWLLHLWVSVGTQTRHQRQ